MTWSNLLSIEEVNLKISSGITTSQTAHIASHFWIHIACCPYKHTSGQGSKGSWCDLHLMKQSGCILNLTFFCFVFKPNLPKYSMLALTAGIGSLLCMKMTFYLNAIVFFSSYVEMLAFRNSMKAQEVILMSLATFWGEPTCCQWFLLKT